MMDEEARNDLEKSLRESARDFRVEPSGKVWDGVYKELHGAAWTMPVWRAAAAALVVAVGIWGICHYEHSRLPGPAANPVAAAEATRPAANLPKETSSGTVAPRQQGTSSLSKTPPGPAAAGIAGAAPAREVTSSPSQGTLPAGAARPAGQQSSVSSSPAPSSAQLSSASPSFTPSGSVSSPPSAVGVSGDYPLAAIDSRPRDAVPALSGRDILGVMLQEAQAPAVSWHAPVMPDSALAGPADGTRPAGSVPQAHRFSWGVYATPAIGYRVFSSGTHKEVSSMSASPSPTGSRPALNSITYQRQASISYRHHSEASWAAGARVYYQLSDRWSLQSGLGLTQTGYRERIYESSAAHVNRNGVAQPADSHRPVNSGSMSYASSAVTPKTSNFNVRYLSVELPVMVHRSIETRGNLSIDLGAGAGVTCLASSKSLIYSPVSGRYFSDDRCLKDFNTNLHIQASLVIPASRHLEVTAGPSLQYQAGSTYKDYDLVREHPYFAGVEVGMKWRR